MPLDPRHGIERAKHEAELWGFKVREAEPFYGEIMVDVSGYGELIELYFRPLKTGYLAFHHAFQHAKTTGTRLYGWGHVRNELVAISENGRCDHFETNTQPGECTACVCADCGEWVGSLLTRRHHGLCGDCWERDNLSHIEDQRDWGDN
jgi:hypothetical protein